MIVDDEQDIITTVRYILKKENYKVVVAMSGEECLYKLKTIKPDLILVMGWSQLLKSEIIKIPKIGIIGSHPTELPKYRGRAPIPWSIIKGLKESALTFFWIEKGTDTGSILDQRKFKIFDKDDASTIYEKIISIGKDMILNNLVMLQQGKIRKIKQDSSKFIEYWQKRTPEDGLIDWKESIGKIHTLIRATTYPYPGAFTYLKGKKLKIWKAHFKKANPNNFGKIIGVSNEGVKVSAKDGIIILKQVSLEDEERISANKLFRKSDQGLILGLK